MFDNRDKIKDAVEIVKFRAIDEDEIIMSPAYGKRVLSINFFWKNDSDEIAKKIDFVESLFKPIMAAVNFSKRFNLTHQDLVNIYGFRFNLFLNTKNSLDPLGVFDNNFSQRVFKKREIEAFHDL